MSSNAVALAGVMLKQDEILSELLENTVKQREALKEGRLSDLQGLMSDLRHISIRCQAIETKRSRVTASLSSELGCEAVVSEIVLALRDEEAMLVDESSKKMMETVKKLKIEMLILSRLMEEAKTLNEMMITEWRRLSQKSMGAGAIGTFDTKI
jgi:hypothetical protein